MQKNYDFKSVDCIFGGQKAFGYQDADDAVSVEYDNDDWDLTVGADGESTRSKSNKLSATIKLKLQSTSAFNDVLNGFLQADRNNNSGTAPFLLKDRLGRELAAAESAWIQKAPPASHGNKVGTREWIIRTDKLIMTFGGN
jgi:hypothetical protein